MGIHGLACGRRVSGPHCAADMSTNNTVVFTDPPPAQNVPRSNSPFFIFLGATGVIIPLMLCAFFYGMVRLTARRARNASSPSTPSDESSEATFAFIVSFESPHQKY